MLYAMLMNWKPGLSRQQMDATFMRRSQWQYPKGAKVVGEYWLSTSAPAVIAIFEASHYEPIMEIGITWSDVFDITTVPATTPEEGLRLGSQFFNDEISKYYGRPTPLVAVGLSAMRSVCSTSLSSSQTMSHFLPSEHDLRPV